MDTLRDGKLTDKDKTSVIRDILELDYTIDINKVFNYIFGQRFKGTSDGKKTFDYLIDFDLIYATFKQYYNIDLIDDTLDWWKFTSLLDGILSTENALSSRVELRGKKIPKANKDNVEYRRNLIKQKARYKLKQDTNAEMRNLFDFLKTKAKGG